MKPAPYNPNTLRLIAAGATAQTLGWDQAFYNSVCRKHGYPPGPDACAIDRHESVKATVGEILAKALEPPKPNDLCRYNTAAREVSRGRAAVALPEKQALMFLALARLAPHVFMPSAELAAKIGSDSVSYLAAALRGSLIRLSLTVHGRAGRGGGGYALLDLQTREPVTVVFETKKASA